MSARIRLAVLVGALALVAGLVPASTADANPRPAYTLTLIGTKDRPVGCTNPAVVIMDAYVRVTDTKTRTVRRLIVTTTGAQYIAHGDNNLAGPQDCTSSPIRYKVPAKWLRK